MISFLLKLLARIWLQRRASPDVRRILVLRVDERMGNLVLTTPLLAALRSSCPQAAIDILVAGRYAGLISDNDFNIAVIPFEKRALFRRPSTWLRLMFKLRRNAYDIVIDASHEHEFSMTSALLALWCGAPQRIGHNKKYAHNVYTFCIEPSPPDMPEAFRKLRLLEPLGFADASSCHPWLGKGSDDAESWVQEWLAENNISGKHILTIFADARKIDRRLSPADFSFIAQILRGFSGWKVVLAAGRGEAEKLTALSNVLADCDCCAAPELDMFALQALFVCSDAVVSADTGPLHLAWALGTPVLSLHTSGNIARWGHADGLNRAIAFVSAEEASQRAATSALRGIIYGVEHHENS